MRSDRLMEVDWRLAELEAQESWSESDQAWLRSVIGSWRLWLDEDGCGPVEFVWESVGLRARRLLVRSWSSTR